MKRLKKIAAILLAILLCVPMVNLTSTKAAGSARVSIGSASGTVGETVSVTVSIDASFQIGAATIYISYDKNVIEPASGSNTGMVTCNFLDSSSSNSQSTSVSFKIKKAGTSALNVAGDSKVISMDYENASITKGSGSVTGTAPASYSSDNTLGSLQISPGVLSPAFSPDVTTYTTSVGSDCGRLTVSATPNDSKATVSVSGTRMDPGMNTTTITVTAENGSKKSYTIKTTKAEDVKTQEEASKAADSPDAGIENNNSSAVQEPSVNVAGMGYKITASLDGHTLPEGYVQSETDYNGIKITVGMGTDTGVMLAYLESEDGTGESGYYVYDSVNKSFSKYIEVSQPELTYCILPIDETAMELPEGYDIGRTDIGGEEVEVLLDRTGSYALFYGVSSTGQTGWFRYNISDGTIQGYAGYNTADEPVFNIIDRKNNSSTGSFSLFKGINLIFMIIIAALAIVIIILAVMVEMLSRKLKVSKKAFVKAMDDYDDSDEYDSTDCAEDNNADYEDNSYSADENDLSDKNYDADAEDILNNSGISDTEDTSSENVSEEIELEEIELEDKNR